MHQLQPATSKKEQIQATKKTKQRPKTRRISIKKSLAVKNPQGFLCYVLFVYVLDFLQIPNFEKETKKRIDLNKQSQK